MSANALYPNVGAFTEAGYVQTALAVSKLRLFGPGVTVGPNTVLADLTAQECSFSGYPSGGKALATWDPPVNNPAGGATFTSGTQQFQGASATPFVSGVINGWFVVDTNGNLIVCGTLSNPVAINSPADGLPLEVILGFSEGTITVLAFGVPQT